MKNEIKVKTPHIRITKDKPYYMAHLNMFASLLNAEKYQAVHFGKQDIRGGYSITLIDHDHCVPTQVFFASKIEMLGYVVGFNAAAGIHYHNFELNKDCNND